MRAHHFFASSILAFSFAAGPAFAQQNKTDEDRGAVDEIIVTAQRQAQSALDVPLSISAMSGEDLAKKGIRDVVSLQFTEPGYLPSDAVGFTQIFVRGVGNSVFGYADPTVPIYIDDVPRLYPTMNAQFFDVERIELLKGAQGGLYGRNATGGVLNIITRQPDTSAAKGDIRLGYGEKNTFEAAAYVNVPLIADKAALSLAAQRNSRDPYVKNISNPNRYTAAMFPTGSFLGTSQQTANILNSGVNPPKGANDQDLWSVNGKLLLQPDDTLKVTLAADYSRKHDRAGTGLVNITPAYMQGTLSFFLNGLFGIPTNLPAGFVQTTEGKFTNALGMDAHNNLDDWGVSGTVTWNGPGFDVTSISAYREQKQSNLVDIVAMNVPLIATISTFRKNFFYQELRLVSATEGPLSWLGGATYLKNHIDSDVRTAILPPVSPGLSTLAVDDVKNWSVYAQLGYNITDSLNITASGRYIHETHKTDFVSAGNATVNSVEKKFLPSVTMSYKLEGGGNIYARWARGFKAGGVNTVQPPSVFPTDQGLIFQPEQVDTYEAGLRANLFDRKVQFTSAIFYNDYKNLQVVAHATAAYPQIIFAIVNAPKARTWGIEGSLTWQALDALTLGVNAGYLDAKYIKYQINSAVLAVDNLDNTRMINSPELQMSMSADLDQPVNDRFRLVGSAVVSHISEVLFQPTGLRGVLPDAAGPGYWVVNGRLGMRTADDRFGFAVYANNIFNEGYFVTGNSSSTFGTNLGWGNPRIIGAEVTAKF